MMKIGSVCELLTTFCFSGIVMKYTSKKPSRDHSLPISNGPSLRGVKRSALELPAVPFSLLELPDVS